MMDSRFISLLLSLSLFASSFAQPKLKLGNDILIERRLDLLKDKHIGLVINHTARLLSGEFLVDVLMKKNINIVALFGPEHGIRGEAAAGEKVSDAKDEKTGIPIFSLYGKIRKPTAEMLTNVDLLVYDIQDVGARFYTYISTMGLSMEAAAEKGIPFIVLDRPNPLGGLKVDGPIMEDSLKSFVGMYPIPIVYGLTCGELAMMINEEGWLKDKVKCELSVIKMEGWKREMLWHDTGLSWIPPSPNIKTPETALVYPATCFIEATNVSEGRGTEKPFQYIGAPFIKGEELSSSLNKLKLPGVKFSPVEFTPSSSKFKGELCRGVFVEVANARNFEALATGVAIIREIQRLHPSDLRINRAAFLRLMGSSFMYDVLVNGVATMKSVPAWEEEMVEYKRGKTKYHLY
jgi:uncharacterized protein YbbC (DUF1343 family)